MENNEKTVDSEILRSLRCNVDLTDNLQYGAFTESGQDSDISDYLVKFHLERFLNSKTNSGIKVKFMKNKENYEKTSKKLKQIKKEMEMDFEKMKKSYDENKLGEMEKQIKKIEKMQKRIYSRVYRLSDDIFLFTSLCDDLKLNCLNDL